VWALRHPFLANLLSMRRKELEMIWEALTQATVWHELRSLLFRASAITTELSTYPLWYSYVVILIFFRSTSGVWMRQKRGWSLSSQFRSGIMILSQLMISSVSSRLSDSMANQWLNDCRLVPDRLHEQSSCSSYLHDRTAVRCGAEIGLLSLRLSISQCAILGDFQLAPTCRIAKVTLLEGFRSGSGTDKGVAKAFTRTGNQTPRSKPSMLSIRLSPEQWLTADLLADATTNDLIIDSWFPADCANND